jgi:hypothetical protein
MVLLGEAQGQEAKASRVIDSSTAGKSLGGIEWECHVDSRVHAYIRVYINGVYRGTIPPFGDIYPIVGDLPHEVTYLYAVSEDGRYWSRTVNGSSRNFHWILNP